MKGYIMIDLEITDPEGFKEYLKLAGPSQKQYGAKVLYRKGHRARIGSDGSNGGHGVP